MNSNYLVNTYIIICVFLLSLFLVGCNDKKDTQQNQVTISSVIDETDPLTATFDVSGIDQSNINTISWDFGDGEVSQESAPVTHTYTASGTYTINVRIEDNNYINYDSTTIVNVSQVRDVNLIVSSFAIDDAIDIDGTPLNFETISTVIQNIGSSPLVIPAGQAGLLHVGYYLSTDETITVDDIYIGDTTIMIGDSFTQGEVPFGFESLGPGENYQYNHQLFIKNNIPTGTYYAGAIVDYIDYYDWYSFPRATDTSEYEFPTHTVVAESNEDDNTRLLEAHRVTVTNAAGGCVNDAYEDDDSSAAAKPISLGQSQLHNFCDDNSDWLQFNAIQGGVYKISTSALGLEADTQLILYDRDASSILLFHDNLSNANPDCPTASDTVDLKEEFPCMPESEIVWEAEFSGTYFIKVRTTACDEDLDPNCAISPDGVGLDTEYTITLQ